MPVATSTVDLDAGFLQRDPSCGSAPDRRSTAFGGALARDPVRFENVGDLVNVPGAGVEGLGRRSTAIAVHGIRPSRNAATATSLAPLSTAGAPPPARPGVEREAQAREGVEVGGLERELRRAVVQSMAPNASASRAGAPRARPMGRRMSGIESCAMVAPSTNSTMLWTIDCGCTTTSIWSNGDAEQLVGLDHLEALVHQRRRVDGDLGAHVPRGVAQGVGDGDAGRAAHGRSPRNGPPLAVRTSRSHLVRPDRPAGTGRARSARCRRGRSRRSRGRAPPRRPGHRRSGSPCWPARGASRARARRGSRAARRSRRPR